MNQESAVFLTAKVMVHLSALMFSLLLRSAGYRFRGDHFWFLGQAAIGTGTLLLPWFDPADSLHLVDLVGRCLGILGMTFFLHSIWKYRYRTHFPMGAYLVMPLYALATFMFFNQSVQAHIMPYSMVQGIMALLVYLLLVIGADQFTRRAATFAAIPILGAALLNLFRPLLGSILPLGGIIPNGSDTAFTLTYSFFSAGLTTYGFFLLAGARMIRDISRQGQVLRKQYQSLETINREKDLFLSLMAHDLRGPVSGSARYVQKHLMNQANLSGEQREAVSALHSSLQRSSELLEKILLWLRAQGSDWHPQRILVDLQEVVRTECDGLAMEAHQKDIHLEYVAVTGKALAEPESLGLMVRNLINNAIKFSRPGSTISVVTATYGHHLDLIVLDEGVGMTKEQVANLFQAERRISTLGTRGERGAGIGLLLCRELALRNHGALKLYSEPGRGTAATITLPLPQPVSPSEA